MLSNFDGDHAESDLGYSRPWMGPFVRDCLETADVPGSLARAKLGWGDYTRFRRSDPSFGLALLEVDMVVRHALWVRLESQAAAGDMRALKLLHGGLDSLKQTIRDLGLDPDEPAVDRRYPLYERVGDYAFPVGPCAQCVRGLVVFEVRDDQLQQAIVRNALVRHFEVDFPRPPGEVFASIPVVYGESRSTRWEEPRLVADVAERTLPPGTGGSIAAMTEAARLAVTLPYVQTMEGDLLLEQEIPYDKGLPIDYEPYYSVDVNRSGQQVYRLKSEYTANGSIRATPEKT